MEPLTRETFDEWNHHPVTKRLMKMLLKDREDMKEGLVYDSYDNPEEVKGRCRAIATLINLSYEDLYDN